MNAHRIRRALYYVFHPRQLRGRIGAVTIHGRSVSYLLRSVIFYYASKFFFYLRYPQRIHGRIGAVKVGGRSVSYLRREVAPYYLSKCFFYLRHPRKALWRLRIIFEASQVQRLATFAKYYLHATNSGFFSNVFYNDALVAYQEDKNNVVSAIELLKRGLALDPSPGIALKLSELQRLANRSQGAIATLRTAFRSHPTSREIWYESLIYVLRFGKSDDVGDLCRSILARDPEYPLAVFFTKIFSDFPHYVETLVTAIGETRDPSKRAHVVGVALWGARRPAQLDGIEDVFGWRLDEKAFEQIDAIVAQFVKDPVGPEFMAPPERVLVA